MKLGVLEKLSDKAEHNVEKYKDHYSPTLLFFLTLLVGLNILDSTFTMIILESGGWEVNPIVRSAIDLYGERFWIWKFGIVSGNVILLCIYSKTRYVRDIIAVICLIYLGIVLYQIMLMTHYLP